MRISLKSFLILFVVILGYLFSQTSFAQDFGGGYDLSGGEEDEANLFLQAAIAEDNALKSKAEIFNGVKSGVYDGGKLACPYAFERDLFVGSTGEDVRLLQVLLNSDRRTLISVSGPGSLGQESDSFGESTKEAVKKFQALFIEYTGVANGRFGPRTRTVMNAICNGENKPSSAPTLEARQNRNIYENIFSVQRGAVPGGIATTNVGVNIDGVSPRVSLSANISAVKMGETFKVILNASEEIVPISPDSLIVEGGTVKEIRKLSKTSYTATIMISEEGGVKNILVQVEADKIEDLAGNKNENASNEISVKVVSETKVASEGGDVEGDVSINSLLDKIIASAPTCTYNGSGLLITLAPDGKPLNTTGCAQTQSQNLAGNGQTYNCNGQQIPVTQPCQNQQTQTVCTTTVNPITGLPMQQCQQMTQQQAAQQQQAQQNQDFGKILGSLLKGQGFGSGQNSQGNSPFGGGGGGGGNVPWQNPDQILSRVQPTAAQIAAAAKQCEGNTGDELTKCLGEQISRSISEDQSSGLGPRITDKMLEDKVAKCVNSVNNIEKCTGELNYMKDVKKLQDEADGGSTSAPIAKQILDLNKACPERQNETEKCKDYDKKLKELTEKLKNEEEKQLRKGNIMKDLNFCKQYKAANTNSVYTSNNNGDKYFRLVGKGGTHALLNDGSLKFKITGSSGVETTISGKNLEVGREYCAPLAIFSKVGDLTCAEDKKGGNAKNVIAYKATTVVKLFNAGDPACNSSGTSPKAASGSQSSGTSI